MAILEVGINLGNRNISEVKYYNTLGEAGLDANLRAGFLSALESFTTEVFGDNINVVSLAAFKLVCFSDHLVLPGKEDNKEALLSYAIIEKDTDVEIVQEHLRKINTYFLNRYSIFDIFGKKKKYFRKFDSRIDEILGDLRMKSQDRFRSLF